MVKVVIDTSSLVQLVRTRGGLLKLKKVCSRGLTLYMSDYLIDELERTLIRKFAKTKRQAKSTAIAVRNISETVQVQTIASVSRDPNDDPIIAFATQSHAQYIVSYDNDILELGSVEGVTILSYDEFMSVLAKLNRTLA